MRRIAKQEKLIAKQKKDITNLKKTVKNLQQKLRYEGPMDHEEDTIRDRKRRRTTPAPDAMETTP